MLKRRLAAIALTRAFWAVFSAFLILVIFQLIAWEARRDDHSAFVPGLLTAAGLFAALALASYRIREESKGSDWLPLIIFIVSLALRLLIIRAIGQNTQQVSDFWNAVAASYKRPENYGRYYNLYPHWYMHIKYLAVIRHIGRLPATGLYANAVVSSLSSALLYAVAARSLRSRKTGFLAAMIFTLWPAHLLYAIVLTPEYLHIFFCLLSLLLTFMAHRAHEEHPTRALVLFLLAGAALALSGFFKTTDRVVLIALLLTALLRALGDPGDEGRGGGAESGARRREALFFLCMAAAYLLSVRAGYLYIEEDSGKPVNRDSYAYFLYIGLSPETGGVWTQEASAYYLDLDRRLDDYDELSRTVLDKLRNEWREAGRPERAFFLEKLRKAWVEDYLWLPDMTMQARTDGFIKPGVLPDRAVHCVQSYYALVCLLSLAAALRHMKRGEGRLCLLSALVVFGFALVLGAIEVQARYKCVVYPFLSILAARGLVLLTKSHPPRFAPLRLDKHPFKGYNNGNRIRGAEYTRLRVSGSTL